ncbi:hypothetical protein Lal_00049430 [Lupinus albus]|nr:hypothetical protein Lal_00049430 [Lupinus albus]
MYAMRCMSPPSLLLYPPNNYSEITESTGPITSRFERTKIFIARIYDRSVPKNCPFQDGVVSNTFWASLSLILIAKRGCQRSSSLRSRAVSRDGNENRTRGYPPEPNPNLTGKTRCDWVRVRVRVLPGFKFRVRVRVWYC